MNDNSTFKKHKERVDFIQNEVDTLRINKGRSFADMLLYRSMDSHLSDLKVELIKDSNKHPLSDFLEFRLRGIEVDFGTIPLEILGAISSNLAALVQRATHKFSSGKDSQKVPHETKSALNLRLADLSPGSTKLGVTFSTGMSELVETTSSKAVKEIFELLNSNNDQSLMNHVAEIGFNSTQSLKRIIDECDRHHLTFDVTWTGPFSDENSSASLDSEKIKHLLSRLSTTTVHEPVIEIIAGELVVLSKYGRLEVDIDGEHLKATYPINMLNDIQNKYKVGQQITLSIETTDIFNESIGLHRKNHLVKAVL